MRPQRYEYDDSGIYLRDAQLCVDAECEFIFSKKQTKCPKCRTVAAGTRTLAVLKHPTKGDDCNAERTGTR